MKAALIILGVLAALIAGVVVLFTLGEVPALIALVVILALAIYGLFATRRIARSLLIVIVIVLLGSVAYGGFGALQLVRALTDTGGTVDAPDPAALASARTKIDAIEDLAGFRLELTEAEITAYVLDGLAGNADNPLQSLLLDVVDSTEPGGQGQVEFDATFQGGGVNGGGAISAELENGEIALKLEKLELGAFQLPGLAEGAIEDLIESVGDLNATLAESGADIQAIEIGSDRVLVTGTQTGTDLLTSEDLLTGLQRNAAAISAAVTPPAERLGPGRINDPAGTTSGSGPFYVALGDSLAANVGVTEARDGYPSRLHNQLEMRDGQQYGLRNFGISGETTGTLIRAGQLDGAVSFMQSNDVAYVTIDIGANNLLGHLGSDDCSQALTDPACQGRIDGAFATYGNDMEAIFDALQDAAPDATVIFMEAYNPFSLGFSGAVALEAESNRVLADFNAVAAGIAQGRGIIVADAFTPMQNTAAATTHMIDAMPDIHPNPIGFDILAAAILDAL